MGRITKSFRLMFREELNSLRKNYQQVLMDLSRRDAFDSIVKAWSSELGAMSYVNIVPVLDVMLLTAVVDNRRLIEKLSEQIGAISSRIDQIQKLTEAIL